MFTIRNTTEIITNGAIICIKDQSIKNNVDIYSFWLKK